MSYYEKVQAQRGAWKATRLSRLYHAYNVLQAHGWYIQDKRELARLRKLEAKIKELGGYSTI